MADAWVVIIGAAKVADGVISLGPASTIDPPAKTTPAQGAEVAATPPYSYARSNIEFEQGTITWEAKLGDPNERAQIFIDADVGAGKEGISPSPDQSFGVALRPCLFAGLNTLGAPYGFAVWQNGKFEGRGGAGLGTKLQVNKWIRMSLRVRGSSLDLLVDGVWVVTTSQVVRRGQIGVMLQGSALNSIRNVRVVAEKPVCFVVMQFTSEFDVLYRDVIRPVCQKYGYDVIRGDDFYTSGQIIDDVTRSIKTAALIIADVTPNNANVFYEVGYAHGIGKPTILLSDRTREKLPFDIAGLRTLFYDNTIGGKTLVEGRLTEHLEALQGTQA